MISEGLCEFRGRAELLGYTKTAYSATGCLNHSHFFWTTLVTLLLLILCMIQKYDLLVINYNKHLDSISRIRPLFKGHLNNKFIKRNVFLCLQTISPTHSRQPFLFFLCIKGAYFFYVLPSISLIDNRGTSTQENEAATHSGLVSLAQEQQWQRQKCTECTVREQLKKNFPCNPGMFSV